MPQNNSRPFGDDRGARRDALNGHGAHHQRHHRGRWNAESEQRNERRLGAGIVGGFRAGDAFDCALAEFGGVAGHFLFQRVGRERGQHRAAAGQQTEKRSDAGAAQNRRNGTPDFLPVRPQARNAGRDGRLIAAAVEVGHDLGEAEQSHRHRHEIDAVVEFGNAEGEARNAALGVGSSQPDQKPQHDHGDRLHDRSMGEDNGGDEPEQHEREIFRRAELLGEGRENRRERRDQQGADAAGKKRSDGSDRERRAGAAALGHAIAVNAGHDRGRLARQVDQNRSGRPSILGAVVNSREHDQRAQRAQPKRDRQQHRNRCDWADTGQDFDQGSNQAPEQAEQQVQRSCCGAESDRQVVQDVH